MTSHITSLLFALTLLLGLGLMASFVGRLSGIPDIVLFILVGLLLGPELLHVIALPASSELGQLIVIGGAVFMLYEGGRSVDIPFLRQAWLSVTLLATLGVVITAAITAVAAHVVLAVPWSIALLAGTVVSATDPATIVPLFAQVNIKARLKHLVVTESACNDATSAVLVVTLVAALSGAAFSGMTMATNFVELLLIGLSVGAIVGSAVQLLVAEDRRLMSILTVQEEDAVATLMAMLGSYTVATLLSGSGFMAAFVAGVVRGNAWRFGLGVHPDRESAYNTFVSLLGTALRMLVFGVLGANIDLSLLGRVGLGGLVVTLVFVFVARPATVFASLSPDRRANWSLKDMVFVSWVRETGVVPAALSTLLLALHIQGAHIIAALVLLAILVTILLQGPTTSLVARQLDVQDEVD